MKVESWPVDRPIPYARNARNIGSNAVDKVAASLKEFGWQQPIVVDEEGVIVVGHTRLEAAKKLGMEQVPVVVAKGLTDAQVKAYRLMDNRSHEEATWDEELLKIEFEDLQGLDIEIGLTGFEMGEIDAILARAGQNVFDESYAPDDLPEPDVSGDDDRNGRFILVYETDEEKQFWMDKLGIDGTKVLYTAADVGGSYASEEAA